MKVIGLTGGIGIEEKENLLGVPGKKVGLFLGEGGAARGDHVLYPGLVQADNIYVSFDQYRAPRLPDLILGQVEPVQNFALLIDWCLR